MTMDSISLSSFSNNEVYYFEFFVYK